MVLKDRNTEDYDSGKKEHFFLSSKGEKMPTLASMTCREGAHQMGIYAQKAAPDSADNLVVAQSVKKHLKPKRDSAIEMKKMSPRNFANLVPTEAYKNVLRDNAKAERIKKLIEDD
jgi:hypothetical protein